MKHGQPLLSLGSCFAEHISKKLGDRKFDLCSNPFGTTYNPLSIADQLNGIRNSRSYNVGDLQKVNDVWFSFDHHGKFNHHKAGGVVEAIQTELESAQKNYGEYQWTTLSLGTAWAWFFEDKVVNNCHQLPESSFEFRLLEIDEMFRALRSVMEKWQAENPENTFILTVSPVRHLRSGLVENNRSKARLLELVHRLVDSLPRVTYYPSYEIVIDDLRDYRFSDSSLTHPSEEAIEYVWEHFSATYFNAHTVDTLKSLESFQRTLNHRPRITSGPAFDGHLKSLDKKFYAWVQRWPEANWDAEKRRWNELMQL